PASKQHDETVQTKGDSAMWRSSVIEGIKQESEFLMSFFHRKAQCLEHLLLDISLVNTHRSAAHFITVQHKVISLCTNFQRIFVKMRNVLLTRSGERMVFSYITLLFLIIAQKREVHDPCKFEHIVIDQSKLTADFETQVAEYISHDFARICGEQNQVAVFCSHAFTQFCKFFFGEEFDDRTSHLSVLDLNPGQTFRTITL